MGDTSEQAYSDELVKVLDQSGTLAEFLPDEASSFRLSWNVVNFVNGKLVDLIKGD